MADACEITNDSATASDVIATALAVPVLVDSGTGIDSIHSGVITVMQDQATATDTPTSEWVHVLSELATASDQITLAVSPVALFTDVARARDTLFIADPPLIQELATATDTLTVAIGADMVDTAAAADTVTLAVAANGNFTDTGRATDTVIASFESVFEDTATATDTPFAVVGANGDFTDTAAASDTLTVLSVASLVFNDAAAASDTITTQVDANSLIVDTAIAEDSLLFEQGGAGWSIPTDSFAMSRFEGVPFNSLATIGGVMVGLTEDGAFVLGGMDDDGDQIAAAIVKGMVDFGDPKLKRSSYVYLGYQCSGKLRVKVGNTQGGAEETFSYELAARVATDPVPGRARVGRGRKSRYYRFSIENVSGADFSIFDGFVSADDTSRKF